ncbi:hypothetical protein Hypma_001048 [Hypsizygus marmoreus]|uniref:Uncharacterized protein n=1 Tax=Hypsizygus marmoreus TaxID=39966 RepID=A0A369JAZ6_HYPMA|nr:hypothetical protein Hypma_001048 [Hypsizygus marmoreus]
MSYRGRSWARRIADYEAFSVANGLASHEEMVSAPLPQLTTGSITRLETAQQPNNITSKCVPIATHALGPRKASPVPASVYADMHKSKFYKNVQAKINAHPGGREGFVADQFKGYEDFRRRIDEAIALPVTTKKRRLQIVLDWEHRMDPSRPKPAYAFRADTKTGRRNIFDLIQYVVRNSPAKDSFPYIPIDFIVDGLAKYGLPKRDEMNVDGGDLDNEDADDVIRDNERAIAITEPDPTSVKLQQLLFADDRLNRNSARVVASITAHRDRALDDARLRDHIQTKVQLERAVELARMLKASSLYPVSSKPNTNNVVI